MNDITTLTQGQTLTITAIVTEPVGRVALHIVDYCGQTLQSASIPATTTDGMMAFTITQEITRQLPAGNVVARVSYELAGNIVRVLYRNLFVYTSDGLDDTTGMPVTPGDNTGGGTVETFTIQAGPVDSVAQATSATSIETTDRGTQYTSPPATMGQYLAFVFPADRRPSALINTAIGADVLNLYTLQPRQPGEPFIYTLGPLRNNATFTYRITY